MTDPAAYPAVIHCSVGKDRTGILVALLLSVVGVEDDDIVADYALSGMGTARLALRLRELCADNLGDLDRFLPALLSAEPDTMRCFLARLRGEFGSVEGYVAHLGMTSAIDYLRDAVLERGGRGRVVGGLTESCAGSEPGHVRRVVEASGEAVPVHHHWAGRPRQRCGELVLLLIRREDDDS